MIRVEFQSSDGVVIKTANAHPLEALIDVCDAVRAPVDFSCRSGSCGTCRVEVIEGQALLQPPPVDEIETLDVFDAPPSHRLACRVRLGPNAGLLRLRWAGDDP